MSEFDHPVYLFARACDWTWEERRARYATRVHPLVASIMAHEDVELTKPPTTEPPVSVYERSRARRLHPPRRSRVA